MAIVNITTITEPATGKTLVIQAEHNDAPVRQAEEEPGVFVDVFRYDRLHFLNDTGSPWQLEINVDGQRRVSLRVNQKTESHRLLDDSDPEAQTFESFNVSTNVSRPLI